MTMTKEQATREALRMALEALENHSGNYKLTKDECVKYRAIEDAIKEALSSPNGEAQPEHRNASEHLEPVGEIGWAANIPNTIREVNWTELCPPVGTKLYTAPPQHSAIARSSSATPLKPLTDEQRNWIVATCPTPRHIIDTV